MALRLREDRLHGCLTLTQKQPIKCRDGEYRLKYHGCVDFFVCLMRYECVKELLQFPTFFRRASLPSVKNFQLNNPEVPGEVCLLLGKVGEDEFNCDFRYPLNAFQAMCLAVTQFML
jgi:hypothetical protein